MFDLIGGLPYRAGLVAVLDVVACWVEVAGADAGVTAPPDGVATAAGAARGC